MIRNKTMKKTRRLVRRAFKRSQFIVTVAVTEIEA